MTRFALKGKGIRKPVFIEGLPGLGNVGKIAVDLLLDQQQAKKLLSVPVDPKPGLVLVRGDGMVRFPELALYHVRRKGRDFLFLAGEGQPRSEAGAYETAQELVTALEGLGCAEIVTLGGIGLQQVPEKPRVYVTGSDRALVRRFKKLGADTRIHGVVGPIIGLTGVLLGVAKGRIPAAALLAESLAHPFHLGLQGAEQVLLLLDKAYGFGIDLGLLHAGITALEGARAPAGDLPKRPEEASYIG